MSVDQELEALADALEAELAAASEPGAALPADEPATTADGAVDFHVDEPSSDPVGAEAIDVAESMTGEMEALASAIDESRGADAARDDEEVVDAALESSLDALIAEADAVIAAGSEADAGHSAPVEDVFEEAPASVEIESVDVAGEAPADDVAMSVDDESVGATLSEDVVADQVVVDVEEDALGAAPAVEVEADPVAELDALDAALAAQEGPSLEVEGVGFDADEVSTEAGGDARSLKDVDASLADHAMDAVSSVVDEAIAAAAREINMRAPVEGVGERDLLSAAATAAQEDFALDVGDVEHDLASGEAGVDSDVEDVDPFATSSDVVDEAIDAHGVEPASEDASELVAEAAADDGDAALAGTDSAVSEVVEEPVGDVGAAQPVAEADELAAAMSAAAMPTDTIEIGAEEEAVAPAPAETTTQAAGASGGGASAQPKSGGAAETAAGGSSAVKAGATSAAKAAAKAGTRKATTRKVKLDRKHVDAVLVQVKQAGLVTGRALSYPLTFVPAAHRSTVGWISVNTVFLGVGVLIVSLMGRGGGGSVGTRGAASHDVSGMAPPAAQVEGAAPRGRNAPE